MKKVGYLYINGLSDGKTKLHEKCAQWWWRRASVELKHAHVDWYRGTYEEKVALVIQTVQTMLHDCDRVVIIGASAGGSLALNAFYELRSDNVYVVNAHGRLMEGGYENTRNSLRNRAHLDSSRPSQSFYDSVKAAENIFPKLTNEDKRRILVLTQLTDEIVPLDTMRILGVETHYSIIFGHGAAYFAHLVCGRDRIRQHGAAL